MTPWGLTPEQIGTGIVGLGIAILTGYNAVQGKLAKREAQAAAGATAAVQATLTTTNGGSHVKDALNRLEEGISGLREDFRDHKTDSARTEAHIFERLERLERRRPRFPFLN
jgi:hypothetical protein